MRIPLLLLCFIAMTTGCSDSDDEVTTIPTISGVFSYTIPDCLPDPITENDCLSSADFDGTSQVSVRLGGSDVLSNFTYRQVVKGIVVLSESVYGFNLNFEVIDANTIKNVADQTLWTK